MGSYHNARVFASLCVYCMMYMLWVILTKDDISEDHSTSEHQVKVADVSHDVKDNGYTFLALIGCVWILIIRRRVITGKW